jgi:hypothetical protein
VAHAALKRGDGPNTTALDLAIGAAWLVALAAALRVVDVALGAVPLAAAMAGAVLVDLALARAGVRWDEAEKHASIAAYARRAAAGVAVGLAVVLVAVAALALAGRARVAPGSPSLAVGVGLVRAASIAVRDELLFRGLVLSVVARAGLPARVGVGFAALAGGAAMALERGAGLASIALVVASGLLFASLWRRERGAFAAVGAHAAFVFVAGPGLRGGLVDVTFAGGVLSAGPTAQGAPAWVAAALFVVLAVVVARRPEGRGAEERRGVSSRPSAADPPSSRDA